MGSLLILQKKWKEGLYIFKTCIEVALSEDHVIGHCWGLLGLITCILHSETIDKIDIVIQRFQANFQDLGDTPEGFIFVTLEAAAHLKRGLYKEAFKATEPILKGLRDPRMQDATFYSFLYYDTAASLLLDLWKGKKQIN